MSEAEEPRHVRPFAEWLQEHRKGNLHIELGEALNELAEAVTLHGKGGELHLVLKLKPAGRADDMVIVADDVRLKLPRPEREEAVFFVDQDSNLSRRNPNQADLPFLREVGEETGEIREVPR
jgi:hypothetical protein